ncbi:MAG: hypothetical protein GY903_08375 [Fuerstiella sp.]|nr:hypothetical protein [Fuerstiella sp.]MCP4854494.1 hypothetical protein [Fuerstiella sp.]
MLTTLPVSWMEEKPQFVTPNQIIPVWSDTVLHQAGQKGSRGCGGRIMFYPTAGKRAVRVDGSLVVYVWDESLQAEDRRPSRKYVFKSKDLQKHYSKSKIGDSYSFWIPWDDAGGARKELTVVARFVGRNGAEIASAPARVILAGAVPMPTRMASDRATDTDSSVEVNADGVRQVSFETNASEKKKRKPYPGLNVSEIHLTPGFMERNLNEPDQGFTGDELFQQAASQNVEAESYATSPDVNAVRNGVPASGEEAILTPPAALKAPPVNRSLRFQDRVRASRESQRSVGRALSERYQSKARTALWEKD